MVEGRTLKITGALLFLILTGIGNPFNYRVASSPSQANQLDIFDAPTLFVPFGFSSSRVRGWIDETPRYLVTYSTGGYNISLRFEGGLPESVHGSSAQVVRLDSHAAGIATLDAVGNGILVFARADLIDHSAFEGVLNASDSFLLYSPHEFTAIRLSLDGVGQISILNHDFSIAFVRDVSDGQVDVTLRTDVFEMFVIVVRPQGAASVAIAFSAAMPPAKNVSLGGLLFLAAIVASVVMLLMLKYGLSNSKRRRISSKRRRYRR